MKHSVVIWVAILLSIILSIGFFTVLYLTYPIPPSDDTKMGTGIIILAFLIHWILKPILVNKYSEDKEDYEGYSGSDA
jgi:hypothetical protein